MVSIIKRQGFDLFYFVLHNNNKKYKQAVSDIRIENTLHGEWFLDLFCRLRWGPYDVCMYSCVCVCEPWSSHFYITFVLTSSRPPLARGEQSTSQPVKQRRQSYDDVRGEATPQALED